ncbi:MAG: tRNA lysidine(34) synthetase TilS [Akkermansiaceae bacterium]
MPLPSTETLRHMLPPRRKHLVGVSGGADSVALLHLLLAAGVKHLVVCHVDHRLRGRESTADAAFVKKLCQKLHLPFFSTRIDVGTIAAERGQSLETSARQVRYEFFARIAKQHRCPRLVLAHHADDQAETLLWNLVRGSHGLKGMRQVQRMALADGEFDIIRPLLTARRFELREYLIENQIAWREDASNAEPFATRNRMRNEVIPLLCDVARRDITPLVLQQLESDADRERLESWALEKIQALDPQGRLHVPVMKTLPPAMQRLVFRDFLVLHQTNSISRDLLDRCLLLLSDATIHSINLPGGNYLRRKAGRIIWQQAS